MPQIVIQIGTNWARFVTPDVDGQNIIPLGVRTRAPGGPENPRDLGPPGPLITSPGDRGTEPRHPRPRGPGNGALNLPRPLRPGAPASGPGSAGQRGQGETPRAPEGPKDFSREAYGHIHKNARRLHRRHSFCAIRQIDQEKQRGHSLRKEETTHMPRTIKGQKGMGSIGASQNNKANRQWDERDARKPLFRAANVEIRADRVAARKIRFSARKVRFSARSCSRGRLAFHEAFTCVWTHLCVFCIANCQLLHPLNVVRKCPGVHLES